MIIFRHSTGISGVWSWANPEMSVRHLLNVESAVYAWRLEYLRRLVRERLDEDAA